MDVELRRVERTAVLLCGATAVVAWVIARGSPWPAVAVLAGGVLIGTSYWSLKSGVGVIDLTAARRIERPRAAGLRIALQLAGRYALLGFMAYVMIVRLRLHPIALLAGASSIVAAVTVEAVRVFMKKS